MNKDQIIIDGVNLSNIRLYLETGHRSSVSTKEFEKIIDLLERKTQEYTELKEDYKELEKRHNEVFQDFERLKKECEELHIAYNKAEDHLGRLTNANEIKSYRIKKLQKALEEIEHICVYLQERSIYAESIIPTYLKPIKIQDDFEDKILDIISKAKGEAND